MHGSQKLTLIKGLPVAACEGDRQNETGKTDGAFKDVFVNGKHFKIL